MGEERGRNSPKAWETAIPLVIIHTLESNEGFPTGTMCGPEGTKSQTEAPTGAPARQAQSRQLVDTGWTKKWD